MADQSQTHKPAPGQRYLTIFGIVSETTVEQIKARLPEPWPDTAICCFLDYANMTVPVGKCLDLLFDDFDPFNQISTPICVRAVILNFVHSVDEIPQGWHTITVLDFPQGLPEIVGDLPVFDAWDTPDRLFILCNAENYEAVRLNREDHHHRFRELYERRQKSNHDDDA